MLASSSWGVPGRTSHRHRQQTLDLIPRLANRFRVIAPDYPGFGYSDAPPPDRFTYTFDKLALTVERLLDHLRVERYVLYLHDYGGPVGFRLTAAHPERVSGLVIQNANAYMDGFGDDAARTMRPFWEARSAETEVPVRQLFSADGIRFQYMTGAGDPEALSPDTWTLDHALARRPGNDAIQLALLFDYQHNLERYPAWQEYFRRHRPPTLIVWGRGDPIFLAAGAEAYRRDLPDAELASAAPHGASSPSTGHALSPGVDVGCPCHPERSEGDHVEHDPLRSQADKGRIPAIGRSCRVGSCGRAEKR